MGRPVLILVDTHVVVWLAFDQSQISSKARAAIDEARELGDGLAISDFTLLEVATLASGGRVHLGISLESFLQEVESRFVVFPITRRACARAMSFSRDLSQRSSRSHHRSHRARRGAFSHYRGS